MTEQNVPWQTRAAEKRDAILKSIPEKWRIAGKIPTAQEQLDVTGPFIQGFLSDREKVITETDAVGIVENTSSGKWTSVEVADAFCHRASLAHQLTNCLHETFFDAALSDAKMLDDYYEKNKAPVGPLHGLPVSLKDQFHVKGVETTMGYVGWIGTFQGDPADKRRGFYESEMVRELRSLGAILYCKTSVPHTLMTGETTNNIIGFTWNPKNRNLASGGSSGGEGALIALRGSPGGFGTDIGGSVRIPAGFNGLYGLRPSAGRLPYEGMANSMDGQNSILSVVGPLATSARALKLLVKALLSQKPWYHDPLVVELPWRDAQEQEILDIISASTNGGKDKLAIGILEHDGNIGVQPPIQRALEIVTQILHKLGHTVLKWQPPSHQTGVDLGARTWSYDGGADVHKDFNLSGEPLAPQITGLFGSGPTEQKDASYISKTNRDIRDYQKGYLDYWNSTASQTGTGRPADAFIMPLAPFAAARPKRYKYYGYSHIINVLDYTASVLPVTTADSTLDAVTPAYESYQPLNEVDRFIHEDYDPQIYHNTPVSLQIVGRRFQEEKMIALTEWLGEEIEKHGDGGGEGK